MNSGDQPDRAGVLLSTLIVGALVANVNLGIANVALPTIGRDLGATQVQLTMVASMFTLGLAATVLYLGAIGDRYGRKKLLLAGAALSIPAALVAGWAPNIEVLILARLVGGIAAGLLFPTTLSLISALWRGNAKTKAIALWSGIGGGAAALGALVGGALLERFWWGSCFIFTAPFAMLVLVVGWFVVPRYAGEGGNAVDHIGGVLSVVAVACLILPIQQMSNGMTPVLWTLLAVSAVAFVAFFVRQRRVAQPLVDLKAASVPTFWVSAVAGTITFGSLIGALFLGQQFCQNILHYDAFEAALVSVPCSVMLMLSAPFAGRMMTSRGSRMVFAIGLFFVALGFAVMFATWNQDVAIWIVLISYGIVGIGVGFAATAASHALMASLPVSRAGMGSAVTDLTRDFGGAIMQALMGTVLAAVYGSYLTRAFNSSYPGDAAELGSATAKTILGSYEGAVNVAQKYPPAQAQELIHAAATGFTDGKSLAFGIGLFATLIALGLVLWKYPGKRAEQEFYTEIAAVSAEQEAAAAR